MALQTEKRVLGVHEAKDIQWLGDGFPTRNVISHHRIGHEISPFLLVDLIGPHEFEPSGERPGESELPFKGLEVVTIVYDGEIEHLDSNGSLSKLGSGDVQWVTAGRGTVFEENHSEAFTDSGGRMEMVRIWINLPAVHKILPPSYQLFKFGGLPRVDLPDDAGYFRAIAGTVNGVEGPALTRTPIVLMEMQLKQGKPIVLPFPDDWSVMILVLDGKIGVENGTSVNTAQLVRFSGGGSAVEFQANMNTTAILMAGEPILEPLSVQDGFAMNTQEEVITAMQEYASIASAR